MAQSTRRELCAAGRLVSDRVLSAFLAYQPLEVLSVALSTSRANCSASGNGSLRCGSWACARDWIQQPGPVISDWNASGIIWFALVGSLELCRPLDLRHVRGRSATANRYGCSCAHSTATAPIMRPPVSLAVPQGVSLALRSGCFQSRRLSLCNSAFAPPMRNCNAGISFWQDDVVLISYAGLVPDCHYGQPWPDSRPALLGICLVPSARSGLACGSSRLRAKLTSIGWALLSCPRASSGFADIAGSGFLFFNSALVSQHLFHLEFCSSSEGSFMPLPEYHQLVNEAKKEIQEIDSAHLQSMQESGEKLHV